MAPLPQDPLQKERRLLRKLADNPTPDQIHHFRTNARRIEAVLDLVFDKPRKNERKLLKQLGRVRRRAGRVRDLDVQITTLQTLHLGREDQCKRQVWRSLRAQRKKALKRLVESVDRRTIARLQKRLSRTAQKLSPAKGNGNRPSFNPNSSDSSSPRTLTARRLQKIQSRFPLSESTLHEYRLRCKRLRYTLELSKSSEAPEVLDQLKKIQDSVGRWHDSVVLLGTAESIIDHGGSCPLISALRNLSKAQLWQALEITRGVMAALVSTPVRKPAQQKPAASTLATAASA